MAQLQFLEVLVINIFIIIFNVLALKLNQQLVTQPGLEFSVLTPDATLRQQLEIYNSQKEIQNLDTN